MIALENDQQYVDKWKSELERYELFDHVNIIHAPLVQYIIGGKEWLWYDVHNLSEDLQFDFAVIDGPPMNTQPMARYPIFEVLGNRFRKDCIALLDDADRKDEKMVVEQWKSEGKIKEIKYISTEKGAFFITLA